HLHALQSLTTEHQLAYIRAHPELIFKWCTCNTVKVAEGQLQEDGHYDICFFDGILLPLNCTRRVIYRVSQIQEGGYVTIYDGFARNESFALNEDATLNASSLADACDDPHEWGPTP